MTEVRSAVLGRVANTTGRSVILHTVPTGSTTLVKSVSAECDDAAQQQVVVWLASPDNAIFATVYREVLEPNTAVTIQTWVAMQQGDRIYCNTGPNCSAWVSGAILNGVIPVQPPVLVNKPADEPPSTAFVAQTARGHRPSKSR